MADRTMKEKEVDAREEALHAEESETGQEQRPKVRFRRTTIDLTDEQFARLNHLAKETHSEPTRGAMIGASTWSSLVRRIADGEVAVVETLEAKRQREARERVRRERRRKRKLDVQ